MYRDQTNNLILSVLLTLSIILIVILPAEANTNLERTLRTQKLSGMQKTYYVNIDTSQKPYEYNNLVNSKIKYIQMQRCINQTRSANDFKQFNTQQDIQAFVSNC